jgi:Flp pilus assembly protein TadD
MKRIDFFLGLVLALITLSVYGPAYHGSFIWDDDAHVHDNPHLRTLRGLWNIWFRIGATPQYYPMTHTSFWIEWQFWADDPTGYHVTNVLLHLLASYLIVIWMKRCQLPGAWLGGFVFALHPLHVESVAWISERKNTLSVVFALLAMIFYPIRERDWSEKQWRFWGLALVSYVAAVLSKTVTCTLPAVLLVITWWKHGQIRKQDVIRLIPWLVVSGLAVLVTSGMERSVVGAEGEDWSLDGFERCLVAARAWTWYLTQFFWPGKLAFSYDRWDIDRSDPVQILIFITVFIIIFYVIFAHRCLGRGLVAGLLIFSGTLFPALGFFNLYPHRYSFVADHFQYHSNIALTVTVCSGLTWFARTIPATWKQAWVVMLVGILGYRSFEQTKIYRDPETLWRDTLTKTPTSWLAAHNLGHYLTQSSDRPESLQEAISLFERTRRLRPQHEYVDWSQAVALKKLGQNKLAALYFDRAEQRYRDRIEQDPRSPNGWYLLLNVLVARERPDQACIVACQASDTLPREWYFAQQAGIGLMESADVSGAIPYLRRWVDLRPNSVEARLRLAFCLEKQGNLLEARRLALEALTLDPSDPRPHRVIDHLTARIRASASPSSDPTN